MTLRLIPQREYPSPYQQPHESVLETLSQLGFVCRTVDEHYLEVTVPNDDFWCTSSGDINKCGLRIAIRPRINGRAVRSTAPLLVAVTHTDPRDSYIRFLAA